MEAKRMRGAAVVVLLGALLALPIASRAAPASQATPAGQPLTAFAQAVKATPGLQAWWRLDERTGDARDASGHGHDAKYGGAVARAVPSLIPTDPDPAAGFPGSDDGSVDAGDALDAPGAQPFSLELWVNLGEQTEPYPRLISKEGIDDANQRQGFLIYLNAESGRLGVERWRDGKPDALTTPNPVAAGQIHHIVATYDGSSLRLYVDGVQAAEGAATRELLDTSYPLRLAARSDGSNGLVGVLDEVAVYNQALPAETIAAHYQAGAGVAPGTPVPAPSPAAAPTAPVEEIGAPTTAATPAAGVVEATAPPPPTATATPSNEAVVVATAGPTEAAAAPTVQTAAQPAGTPQAGLALGSSAVTTADLNLRAGPSEDADVLTVIPSGSTVDLLGDTVGDYVSAEFDGQVGWVARQYLQPGG
jgi:Concanavalin A-like lectin/glucanases superfamily/Bacterial SH3 domain